MENISLNFGVIKESVAKKAAVELTRNHNGNTLMLFMESIKKSPVLKKQHYVYKSLETAKPFKKERIAERFLNQNLKIISDLKWTDIISENKAIRKSLLGLPDESTVVAKEDKIKLFESISTLIEAKLNPAFKDLEKEANAYDYVIEYLTREVEEEKQNKEEKTHPHLGKIWEYITKNAVSNFNERFSHLNENEKQLFKILIAEGDQKINYIKSLKEETKSLIREKQESTNSIEDKNILSEFYKKIEKKVDRDTMISDDYVFHICDLNQSLKSL